MHGRALALGAALALAVPARADLTPAPRAAPNCALSALADAQRYDVRQFRGQVLWVDFWASWCGPCAELLPFLDDLQRDFGERGLAVLGVNVDEEPKDAHAFLAKHPVAFVQTVDPSGECPRQFGVEAMPAGYLVDRQGMIRHVRLGFRPGQAGELRGLVEALLAEAPPDAAH